MKSFTIEYYRILSAAPHPIWIRYTIKSEIYITKSFTEIRIRLFIPFCLFARFQIFLEFVDKKSSSPSPSNKIRESSREYTKYKNSAGFTNWQFINRVLQQHLVIKFVVFRIFSKSKMKTKSTSSLFCGMAASISWYIRHCIYLE